MKVQEELIKRYSTWPPISLAWGNSLACIDRITEECENRDLLLLGEFEKRVLMRLDRLLVQPLQSCSEHLLVRFASPD